MGWLRGIRCLVLASGMGSSAVSWQVAMVAQAPMHAAYWAAAVVACGGLLAVDLVDSYRAWQGTYEDGEEAGEHERQGRL